MGIKGPVIFILTGLYRLIGACRNRSKTGMWVDKANSNYWRLAKPEYEELAQEDENPCDLTFAEQPSPDKVYIFRWKNLMLVLLTQALPVLLDLFVLSHTFQVAKLGQLNDAYITCLFSLTSIYVAVMFHFAFREELSRSKIVGMLLMVVTVITLTTNKHRDTDNQALTEISSKWKQFYQLTALALGVLGPYMWTCKYYYLKIALELRCFHTEDLAVDQYLITSGALSCVFLANHAENTYDGTHLFLSSVTALFFFLGTLCSMKAFENGQGGPILALVSSQVLISVLLHHALFSSKGLSGVQLTGLACGLVATVIITMWDLIHDFLVRSCHSKKDDDLDEEPEL